MEEKRKYALFAISDDTFAVGLKVTIYSFIKHNQWFDGDIVIIDDGISEYNKNIMLKIYSKIKFIIPNPDKYKEINKYFNISERYHNVFYKFEAFDLDTYDKVIILDGDILITGSYQDLFEIPMEQIAVQQEYEINPNNILNKIETEPIQEYIADSKFKYLRNYYNAGIVVIPNNILKQKLSDTLILFALGCDLNFIMPNKAPFKQFNDQSVINKYFNNQILPLNFKYMVFQTNYVYANSPKYIDNNICGIHYLYSEKPWKTTGKYNQCARIHNIWAKYNREMKSLYEPSDLLSIIVPCYNVEKYISRCLISIQNQTYTNFECILINDGSTDNTLEVLKRFKESDSRFILINKKNSGVSDSRNIGLDIAKGEWIGFVDADDWINPDMFETLINTAIENNEKIVKCNSINTNGESTIIYKEGNNSIEDFYHLLEDYKEQDTAAGVVWSIVFHKSIVTDIRFDHRLRAYEDLIFKTSSVLKNNGWYQLSDNLYHSNIENQNSICHNTDKINWTELSKYAYEDIKNIPDTYWDLKKIVYWNISRNVPNAPLLVRVSNETKKKVDEFLEKASNPDMEKLKQLSDEAHINKQIPKILHFCFINYKNLDDAYYPLIETWIDNLKDYTFVNWTPKLLGFTNNYLDNVLNDHKWAFYADYIRAYATYNYGGFYSDCDVAIYKSFDELLNMPYVFDCENSMFITADKRKRLEAGIFGVRKGFKLMNILTEFYNSINLQTGHKLNYNVLCAPFLWNALAEKNGINISYNFGDLDTVKGCITDNENEILSLNSTYFSKTDMQLPYRCLFARKNGVTEFHKEDHAFTSHQLFSEWL